MRSTLENGWVFTSVRPLSDGDSSLQSGYVRLVNEVAHCLGHSLCLDADRSTPRIDEVANVSSEREIRTTGPISGEGC